MRPSRKDPITNQDSTRIIIQQDPILPPFVSKQPTGYKPFLNDTHFSNKTEEEHNNSTDNLRTENKDSVKYGFQLKK